MSSNVLKRNPDALCNTIWIELEKIENKQHAEEQVKLANTMLRRLGITVMHFWVGERRGGLTYNIQTSEAGTYLECIANGHIFNLDHLGRAE